MKRGVQFTTVLLLLVLQTSVISCRAFASEKAEYLKFSAAGNSIFNKITFEYPNTWTWSVYSDDPSQDFGNMHANDPEALDENALEKVSVSIDVYGSPIEAKSAMEKQITAVLNTTNLNKGKLIADQALELNGYPARQIITQHGRIILTEGPVYGPSISEYFFVLVGSSYYTISFSAAEGNRNGKFGQEFDRMVETIQILP